MCMCGIALLKAKMFKAFHSILQFIWGMGQILGKK